MDLQRALEFALDGDAILFLGAGFSVNATNLRGQPFKMGSELAIHFNNQTGIPQYSSLEDAAEEFANQLGEDRLIMELREEFTASSFADEHRILAQIPWRRVYTTNYDNVFEVASNSVSRPIQSVTLRDVLSKIPKDPTLCIHFNGYIERLTRDTVWSEIKLTETSYLTADVAASSWATFFRQDISMARAVFFVGYSASDLDIKRILFEESSLQVKTFLIIGPSPNDITVRRAGRFGQVLQLSTREFALDYQRITQGYLPREDYLPLPYCLTAYESPVSTSNTSDSDVFDLLMRGELNANLVGSSIHGSDKYYLEREEVKIVTELIDQGTPAVILHSDLGNGKTALVEGIKYRAVVNGFTVFSLDRKSFDIMSELENIVKPSEKTILVIEDYHDWLDELQFICNHRSSRLQLLLTARSTPHDVFFNRLQNFLGDEGLQEIAIDELRSPEVDWMVGFLDLYGLWGKDAGKGRHKKTNIIEDRCKAQMSSILLYILESPQMASRVDELLSQLNDQRDYYEVLIAIFVIAVILQYPPISVLVDIFGDRVLSSQFSRHPVVRQLVDFDSSRIRMRSSVVARFILRQIADPNITVNVLEKMARVANNNARLSSLHKDIGNKLMRFSLVESVLPEREKSSAVYKYFESIKNLDRAKSNPYFWLQYAIAATVFGDYERAESYFETSYSYASRIDWFNPYQIDNHYSRFLLLKAIRGEYSGEIMTSFRRARTIINRQVTERERFHYPYRVASLYSDFYDVFSTSLSIKQKNEIFRAGKFITKRIGQLPKRLSDHPVVRICAHNMEYLLMRGEEDGIES